MATGHDAATPLALVLAALPAGRLAGGQWLFRCPAHADRRPSLAVRELRDGRVLVHCHAGCATEDVLAAIGLEITDLFPDDGWADLC